MQPQEKKEVSPFVTSNLDIIQQVLRSNDKVSSYNFNPLKKTHLTNNISKQFSEAQSKYFIVKTYQYDQIEPPQTQRIIKCIAKLRESKDKPMLLAVQNLVNIVELLKDHETNKIFVQFEDDIGDSDLSFYFHHLNEPLPLETVFNFMYQMARGLALCQLHRIYHKDVKPSNFILMKGLKNELFVKLIDFNISKLLRTTTGQTTHNKGTHAYWSFQRFQEQANPRIKSYKFEHDVYSLGITFLEMVVAGTTYLKHLKTMVSHHAETERAMMKKTDKFNQILDQLESQREKAWSTVFFIIRKLLTPEAKDRGDFLSLLGFLKSVVSQRINSKKEYDKFYQRECKLCKQRNRKQEDQEKYLTELTQYDRMIDLKLKGSEMMEEVPEFSLLHHNPQSTIPYLNLKDLKLYIFNYSTQSTQHAYSLENRDLPLNSTILYNKVGFLGVYGGGLRAESFRPSEAHFKIYLDAQIDTERRLPDNGHSQTAGVFINPTTVFLLGGMNGNGHQEKNCIWYNYKESKEWNHGPPLKYPRLYPGAVCVGQVIYVLGGVWSQGAESLDVDQLYYHQRTVECFDRSDPFPKWQDINLPFTAPVLSVQCPFTIPLDDSHFIMFGGRRYKYLKDEGVYLCNVETKRVTEYTDWFYELRITPTNPIYKGRRKNEFYFGHQFLGRESPQFFSLKLLDPENAPEHGRVEVREFKEE